MNGTRIQHQTNPVVIGTRSGPWRSVFPYSGDNVHLTTVASKTRGFGPTKASRLKAVTDFLLSASLPAPTGSDANATDHWAMLGPLDISNILMLRFFGVVPGGAAGSANNLAGKFRFWGVDEVVQSLARAGGRADRCAYVATYLGQVAVTAGDAQITGAAADSEVLPSGTNAAWVKTITITEDATLAPGMRVIGASASATDESPVLVFDRLGHQRIIVSCEADVDDGIGFGAIYRQV